MCEAFVDLFCLIPCEGNGENNFLMLFSRTLEQALKDRTRRCLFKESEYAADRTNHSTSLSF